MPLLKLSLIPFLFYTSWLFQLVGSLVSGNPTLSEIDDACSYGCQKLHRSHLAQLFNQSCIICTGQVSGIPRFRISTDHAGTQAIEIRQNNLTRINADDLEGRDKLRYLDFAANRIGQVEDDWGKWVPRLTRLYLSHNRITVVTNATFAHLLGLQYLYLDNNLISQLPRLAFVGLRQLQTLHLEGNHLRNLTDYTFEGLDGLRKLNLSDNKIHSLSVTSFAGLELLNELLLGKNKMKRIVPNSFQILGKLEHLYLEDNNIDFLNKNDFANLTNLIELTLAGNNICGLERGWSNGLSSLQYLNLSGNKVKKLDSDAFVCCPNLSIIDLNRNMLINLPSGIFRNQLINHVVDLRFNNLTTLSRDTVNERVVTDIRLSGNPLECDCRISWIQEALRNETIALIPYNNIPLIWKSRYADIKSASRITDASCISYNMNASIIPILDVSFAITCVPMTPVNAKLDFHCRIGVTVILPCPIRAHQATVYWVLPSQQELHVGKSFQSKTVQEDGALTINITKTYDNGSYTCVSTNIYGRKNETVSLFLVQDVLSNSASTPECTEEDDSVGSRSYHLSSSPSPSKLAKQDDSVRLDYKMWVIIGLSILIFVILAITLVVGFRRHVSCRREELMYTYMSSSVPPLPPRYENIPFSGRRRRSVASDVDISALSTSVTQLDVHSGSSVEINASGHTRNVQVEVHPRPRLSTYENDPPARLVRRQASVTLGECVQGRAPSVMIECSNCSQTPRGNLNTCSCHREQWADVIPRCAMSSIATHGTPCRSVYQYESNHQTIDHGQNQHHNEHIECRRSPCQNRLDSHQPAATHQIGSGAISPEQCGAAFSFTRRPSFIGEVGGQAGERQPCAKRASLRQTAAKRTPRATRGRSSSNVGDSSRENSLETRQNSTYPYLPMLDDSYDTLAIDKHVTTQKGNDPGNNIPQTQKSDTIIAENGRRCRSFRQRHLYPIAATWHRGTDRCEFTQQQMQNSLHNSPLSRARSSQCTCSPGHSPRTLPRVHGKVEQRRISPSDGLNCHHPHHHHSPGTPFRQQGTEHYGCYPRCSEMSSAHSCDFPSRTSCLSGHGAPGYIQREGDDVEAKNASKFGQHRRSRSARDSRARRKSRPQSLASGPRRQNSWHGARQSSGVQQRCRNSLRATSPLPRRCVALSASRTSCDGGSLAVEVEDTTMDSSGSTQNGSPQI